MAITIVIAIRTSSSTFTAGRQPFVCEVHFWCLSTTSVGPYSRPNPITSRRLPFLFQFFKNSELIIFNLLYRPSRLIIFLRFFFSKLEAGLSKTESVTRKFLVKVTGTSSSVSVQSTPCWFSIVDGINLMQTSVYISCLSNLNFFFHSKNSHCQWCAELWNLKSFSRNVKS